MFDKFNREINYLRISVTDKCNLRCTYCMPEEGIEFRKQENFLTFEEIVEIVKAASELGINKIRLTGGEPLVKRDIVDLVRKISKIDGIEKISMTTNGVLLSNNANDLKDAGLTSINVSLDTLDPNKYSILTRGGKIQNVLEGIDSAIDAGFPVKLNMVVSVETKDIEIEIMQRFCDEKCIQLQLINHFSLITKKRDNYIFDRPPNCSNCNRIRLLADGSLKPCLHSNSEIKVDMNDIKSSLIKTILQKPILGDSCDNRSMIEIGG